MTSIGRSALSCSARVLGTILPWLATIPLIAIRFPVFTDGRGYSLARLLRGRHGYAGELRAVGDDWRVTAVPLPAPGV